MGCSARKSAQKILKTHVTRLKHLSASVTASGPGMSKIAFNYFEVVLRHHHVPFKASAFKKKKTLLNLCIYRFPIKLSAAPFYSGCPPVAPKIHPYLAPSYSRTLIMYKHFYHVCTPTRQLVSPDFDPGWF